MCFSVGKVLPALFQTQTEFCKYPEYFFSWSQYFDFPSWMMTFFYRSNELSARVKLCPEEEMYSVLTSEDVR